ncbi:MAG TPA: hypothetical protein VGO71_14770 [Baekduia sp.]|jgi:hypothetical protein|nr:hypothetical protein [Baekduia sp.]
MLLRRTSVAAAAAIAALAVGAPVAGAFTWPTSVGLPAVPAAAGQAVGPCGTISDEGQGRASGNEASVCQGSGLAFIGPSVGQLATIVGPTIISPGFVGTVILTTGNVAVGP